MIFAKQNKKTKEKNDIKTQSPQMIFREKIETLKTDPKYKLHI